MWYVISMIFQSAGSLNHWNYHIGGLGSRHLTEISSQQIKVKYVSFKCVSKWGLSMYPLH